MSPFIVEVYSVYTVCTVCTVQALKRDISNQIGYAREETTKIGSGQFMRHDFCIASGDPSIWTFRRCRESAR